MSFTESFQLKYTWQFTTEYLPELWQVPGLIESIVSSIDFHMAVEIASACLLYACFMYRKLMQHWKSTLKGMEPQSTAKTYSIGLCLPLVIIKHDFTHS